VCSSGHRSRFRRYWSSDRKPTTALNFCGGRFAKEGIGGVGFRNVEAIAWGSSSDPMCVSSGPGPLLPFDPS